MDTTVEKLQKAVAGKQLIVDSVNSKAGTNFNVRSKPKDISDSILNITTGINITDATATPNDILFGKIAYNNDGRIEGSIETYDYSNSEGIIPEVPEIDLFFQELATELINERITKIAPYKFEHETSLKTAIFPNVLELGDNCFKDCKSLQYVDVRSVKKIGNGGFTGCSSLESISLENLESMLGSVFTNTPIKSLYLPNVQYAFTGSALHTSNIEVLHIPNAKTITGNALYKAHALKAIIIEQEDSVCALTSLTFTDAYHYNGTVNSTHNPEGLKDGYFYVPDSRYEEYIEATNWSAIADQIKPLSEYVREVE